MTGLPFVYAAWCGRPGAAGDADVAALQDAQAEGVRSRDAIADERNTTSYQPSQSCQHGSPPLRAVRTESNEFVFLMAQRGAASITALHDKLYTRSLRQHLRPEFRYAPHLTLARHADFAAVERACAEAEDLFREEMSDVMREVTLLSVAPDGRITPLKSIALNAS